MPAPPDLFRTHCCKETPNCWLGRGGRGGMGLGAVAGLFCVDLRKSSYLRSSGEGQPQSGPAVTTATLMCQTLGCLTRMTSFSPRSNPVCPAASEDFRKTHTEPGAELPVYTVASPWLFLLPTVVSMRQGYSLAYSPPPPPCPPGREAPGRGSCTVSTERIHGAVRQNKHCEAIPCHLKPKQR